jgi:fluoride exporter
MPATMREFLVIAVGAALGANARYWLTNLFAGRFGAAFPWGTLFINVSGGLVIGLVLTLLSGRLVADPTYRLLLATGFLGAYTTFSTFTYETLGLAQQGDYLGAFYNVAGSVTLGLLATFGGILLGRAIA